MANLISLQSNKPGSLGLNTQAEGEILPVGWATDLLNVEFDNAGRTAARNGYKNQHTTAVASASMPAVHQYVDAAGDTLTIMACGNKIVKWVAGTVTDISGSITTPTADNWQFTNFNGKCVGFQIDHTAVVLSTTAGTFSDITASVGTLPNSNVVLSAFGRLWTVEDNVLIWSDLLLETHWSGGSSGSQDLALYWPSTDYPVALAEHNGLILIFGERNILIYQMTTQGDPTTLTKVEAISGAGAIGRDAVVTTPNDIMYTSRLGVMTMGRTIQEKSAPISVVSSAVLDAFNDDIAQTAADDVKAMFTHRGIYYVKLTDYTWLFDTRGQLRVSQWDFKPSSMVEINNVVYYGTSNGFLARKTGYLDGTLYDDTSGSTYQYVMSGPWNGFGEQLEARIKIGRYVRAKVLGASGQPFKFTVSYDYDDTPYTFNLVLPGASSSEWNEGEWGTAEWSGSADVFTMVQDIVGEGEVVKWGITATVNQVPFAVHSIMLRAKVGRLAN